MRYIASPSFCIFHYETHWKIQGYYQVHCSLAFMQLFICVENDNIHHKLRDSLVKGTKQTAYFELNIRDLKGRSLLYKYVQMFGIC